MFKVGVKDYILIAHSLRGEVFGPARNVHGCTYVIEAEFQGESLDENGIIIDIGIATSILKDTLGKYNYKNLDEFPEFAKQNSTTEFLAKTIFEHIKNVLSQYNHKATFLKITLNESHVAWASYEGKLI